MSDQLDAVRTQPKHSYEENQNRGVDTRTPTEIQPTSERRAVHAQGTQKSQSAFNKALHILGRIAAVPAGLVCLAAAFTIGLPLTIVGGIIAISGAINMSKAPRTSGFIAGAGHFLGGAMQVAIGATIAFPCTLSIASFYYTATGKNFLSDGR